MAVGITLTDLFSAAMLLAVLLGSGVSLYRRGVSVGSLPFIYPIITSAFYLGGFLYYSQKPEIQYGAINLPFGYYYLNDAVLAAAAHVSIVFSIALLSRSGSRLVLFERAFFSRLAIRYQLHLLLLCSFLLLVAILAFGIDNLLGRDTYQVERHSQLRLSIQSLGDSLASLAPGVLGILFFASQNRAVRAICAAMLCGYLLYFVGTTSRFLAVAPIEFILGGLLVRPPKAGYWAGIALVLVLSSLLITLPLASRQQLYQGIVPSLALVLRGYDVSDYLRVMPDNLLSPIWIASLTLGKVGGLGGLSGNEFFISVNPAPGVIAGWYEISEGLRVNVFVPFNLIGELAAYGWFCLIAYSLVFGAAMNFISMRVSASRSAIGGVMVLSLVVLATILALQYNVRAVTRQVYYAILVATILVPMLRIAPRIRFRGGR